MPQIMEHATSQSLMIQKPRLPVREVSPVYPHLTKVSETPESQQWHKQSSLFSSLWLGAIPLYE